MCVCFFCRTFFFLLFWFIQSVSWWFGRLDNGTATIISFWSCDSACALSSSTHVIIQMWSRTTCVSVQSIAVVVINCFVVFFLLSNVLSPELCALQVFWQFCSFFLTRCFCFLFDDFWSSHSLFFADICFHLPNQWIIIDYPLPDNSMFSSVYRQMRMSRVLASILIKCFLFIEFWINTSGVVPFLSRRKTIKR